MLIVYGIPHCDTVKAARQWLTEHGVAHEFHDLRKEHHLDVRTLEHWLERIGRQRLVNRSSATWRTLDSSQREQVESGNPVPVILANPTLVKRPVLVGDGILHVGFSAAEYERLFPAA
ncbi:MAG: Spx/MgsR family RNA polymerase-binding regulatory protein [Gammaproteobacteria bacterium]